MKFSDSTMHYFWGAVGGAAATLMIAFSWDFVLSPAAAERLGKQRADAAVAQALAPFCVASFRSQKDASAKLVELKKQDQYQQVTFIEKGGWATMPGATAPNSNAAKVCAETLSNPQVATTTPAKAK